MSDHAKHLMQIMEGNIVETIRDNVDIFGHFHVAGIPGRADEAGYAGRFGLEYFPEVGFAESLQRQLGMV